MAGNFFDSVRANRKQIMKYLLEIVYVMKCT